MYENTCYTFALFLCETSVRKAVWLTTQSSNFVFLDSNIINSIVYSNVNLEIFPFYVKKIIETSTITIIDLYTDFNSKCILCNLELPRSNNQMFHPMLPSQCAIMLTSVLNWCVLDLPCDPLLEQVKGDTC